MDARRAGERRRRAQDEERVETSQGKSGVRRGDLDAKMRKQSALLWTDAFSTSEESCRSIVAFDRVCRSRGEERGWKRGRLAEVGDEEERVLEREPIGSSASEEKKTKQSGALETLHTEKCGPAGRGERAAFKRVLCLDQEVRGRSGTLDGGRVGERLRSVLARPTTSVPPPARARRAQADLADEAVGRSHDGQETPNSRGGMWWSTALGWCSSSLVCCRRWRPAHARKLLPVPDVRRSEGEMRRSREGKARLVTGLAHPHAPDLALIFVAQYTA